MKICIAFVSLGNGTEAVLRGSPEAVSHTIRESTEKTRGEKILCQVQDTVSSKDEEKELWLWFIGEAAKKNLASVAKEKYEIWRRKATTLWETGLPEGVCVFMRNEDDMIVQIPLPDGFEKQKIKMN